MDMKTIDAIVEGGKATAGPPLGPALGPLGVNAGQVVAKINEATKEFAGMKVPVKVHVDPKAKTFTIEVGSPPTAEIIKKEAGIEKGAGNREAPAGNIPLEKLVKIAKAKKNSLARDAKETLKEILGSCISMGVNVDGKKAKDVMKEIDEGKHDSLLKG
ncbi:MAG: 50S ribosomal protein L11 [Candidatus ainarchaeum sp.]|nr:50S ribosomal protein L11 [Candidatus ainarchaeum sp.]